MIEHDHAGDDDGGRADPQLQRVAATCVDRRRCRAGGRRACARATAPARSTQSVRGRARPLPATCGTGRAVDAGHGGPAL